jgi:hypothetical protein
MRVRMKLVVPLTMPMTRTICSPASDSRSGRMTGMAPATAASYSRSTPARPPPRPTRPRPRPAAPCWPSPPACRRRAASISSWAGWSPPMSSTTTSTSAGPPARRRRSRSARPGCRRAGRSASATAMPDQLEADPGAGGDVVLAGQQELGQRAPTLPQPSRPRAPSGLGWGCRLAWGGHRPVRYRLPACSHQAGRGLTSSGSGRRRSPGGRPPGRCRRPRRRRPAAAPCCNWTPWRSRRRR